MPTDEVARAELRLANERRAAENKRRLADIERRLKALKDREEAKRQAALVDAILNATLRAPEVF
jgi:hypothetical protein